MDDFPTKHRDVHKNVKLLEGSPFFSWPLVGVPYFQDSLRTGGARGGLGRESKCVDNSVVTKSPFRRLSHFQVAELNPVTLTIYLSYIPTTSWIPLSDLVLHQPSKSPFSCIIDFLPPTIHGMILDDPPPSDP